MTVTIEELEKILDVLLALRTDPRYPGTEGAGCWCDLGIDHPLAKRHSGACTGAQELVRSIRGRLGIVFIPT